MILEEYMAKQTFEEKINELQKIVTILEDENSSLEQCIELYDKGTKLAAECNKILDQAQSKIVKMSDDGNDGFSEEEFVSEEG